MSKKKLMLEEKVFHVNKKVDVGGKSISCQQKKLMLDKKGISFRQKQKIDVGGKSISCQQQKLMLEEKVFHVNKKS